MCGVYGADFYKGTPCLTRNTMGKGQAWYVGSSPERRFLHGLARLCQQTRVARKGVGFQQGIQVGLEAVAFIGQVAVTLGGAF